MKQTSYLAHCERIIDVYHFRVTFDRKYFIMVHLEYLSVCLEQR